MKLLAIETATESCSAALLIDDEIISLSEVAPRRHNEIILPMCEQVLAQGQISLSQLDAISFGRGPGAFTGVRLAASVTQGIALGQDLPVVPVSSLASLAQAAAETMLVTQVLSCIDARMQEIYYGLYTLNNNDVMELVGVEKVIAANKIAIMVDNNCYGAGSGWGAYSDDLHEALGEKISFNQEVFPQAEYVAKLGKVYFEQGSYVSAVEALPVYLRDNVADKPKNKMVF
ncbi:MAG: tRNA (adenosine(37)-N6)-threonylcarbamoyltransferase complex dimerization subunit type 1 TsaB [Gammaproteobacteria bacterium]